MNDYEMSLQKTMEFCDLILSNVGKHGITEERVKKAKQIKSEYQGHLEKYRSINRENAPVKQTRTFSR